MTLLGSDFELAAAFRGFDLFCLVLLAPSVLLLYFRSLSAQTVGCEDLLFSALLQAVGCQGLEPGQGWAGGQGLGLGQKLVLARSQTVVRALSALLQPDMLFDWKTLPCAETLCPQEA